MTRPVKDATLIGNGPDVLKCVSAVGNDLQLDEGIGTCGKDGQTVPVGVGLPDDPDRRHHRRRHARHEPLCRQICVDACARARASRAAGAHRLRRARGRERTRSAPRAPRRDRNLKPARERPRAARLRRAGGAVASTAISRAESLDRLGRTTDGAGAGRARRARRGLPDAAELARQSRISICDDAGGPRPRRRGADRAWPARCEAAALAVDPAGHQLRGRRVRATASRSRTPPATVSRGVRARRSSSPSRRSRGERRRCSATTGTRARRSSRCSSPETSGVPRRARAAPPRRAPGGHRRSAGGLRPGHRGRASLRPPRRRGLRSRALPPRVLPDRQARRDDRGARGHRDRRRHASRAARRPAPSTARASPRGAPWWSSGACCARYLLDTYSARKLGLPIHRQRRARDRRRAAA